VLCTVPGWAVLPAAAAASPAQERAAVALPSSCGRVGVPCKFVLHRKHEFKGEHKLKVCALDETKSDKGDVGFAEGETGRGSNAGRRGGREKQSHLQWHRRNQDWLDGEGEWKRTLGLRSVEPYK
jgi:hypothetical protein